MLLSFEVALPPLGQQRTIVSLASQVESRHRSASGHLTIARHTIERFRQAVLASACSGRLTANWREKDEEQPSVENVFNPTGDLPDHMASADIPASWRWARLKEMATSIQYGFTASSTTDAIGPRLLRITDIQDGRVDWSSVPHCFVPADAERRYRLRKGDLVFARTGATTGKSFLLRAEPPRSVFASYLIRVRLTDELDQEYTARFFESPLYWAQIADASVGTGQPNVNGTRLSELWVPLPSPAEQHEIVRRVNSLFSRVESVETRIVSAVRASVSLAGVVTAGLLAAESSDKPDGASPWTT